jgi:2-polyprenyl-3-methyl-5-hydroxy-6-metoxy-1,4-benzoquinol methylase
MSNWYNLSGRPLSSLSWLEAHHLAKLPERTNFAKLILERRPKRIVDLGCGSGIWLDLFNQYAELDCEFIGLDTDQHSISAAESRASSWSRKTSFRQVNIEDADSLPDADIYLVFNIFPYVKDSHRFLEMLRQKIRPCGAVVVRQYDGALLRFGPIDHRHRQSIDLSLHTSLSRSEQFRHYDIDRTFEALATSGFSKKNIDFEVYKRTSPYPSEFVTYLKNTIEWTGSYISNEASELLRNWYEQHRENNFSSPSYFTEFDLIAWLS